MNDNQHLVVVGGGPGGLATARAYREAGGRARVTLLAAEGHPPYNRPPLTKEYLRGEVQVEDLPMQGLRWYAEHAVERRLSTRVAGLDTKRGVVEIEGGEELAYDACVLATGSEPIRIPVPGGEMAEVLVMRTIEDSTALRERATEGSRAVVVGSGFIGCEAAASLSMRGVRVTLVSQEDEPQEARLGAGASQRIRGWLEGYGVDLRLGTNVEGIERRAGSLRVTVEGGDAFDAETVLFGTGVRARTGLAQAAGLEVEKGGVVCDSSMRTSAENVYAVGDIAFALNEAAGRRLHVEHWGEALNHGGVAGKVIAGGEAAWDTAPGFWSTMGTNTLKYAAWGDGFDEDLLVEHGADGAFTAWYGREGVCVGVLTHGRDKDYEDGRELVENGRPFPR